MLEPKTSDPLLEKTSQQADLAHALTFNSMIYIIRQNGW